MLQTCFAIGAWGQTVRHRMVGNARHICTCRASPVVLVPLKTTWARYSALLHVSLDSRLVQGHTLPPEFRMSSHISSARVHSNLQHFQTELGQDVHSRHHQYQRKESVDGTLTSPPGFFNLSPAVLCKMHGARVITAACARHEHEEVSKHTNTNMKGHDSEYCDRILARSPHEGLPEAGRCLL